MNQSALLSLLLLSALALIVFAKKGDHFATPSQTEPITVDLHLNGYGSTSQANCEWKGKEGLIDAIAGDSHAIYCHKESTVESDAGIAYITFSAQVQLVNGSYVQLEMMRGTDGTCSATSPRFTLEWADGTSTTVPCTDMTAGYIMSTSKRDFENRNAIVYLTEDKTLNSILLTFSDSEAFVYMDNIRVFIPGVGVDRTFTSASDMGNGSGQTNTNNNGGGNGNGNGNGNGGQ
jgi:hypothetical protein